MSEKIEDRAEKHWSGWSEEFMKKAMVCQNNPTITNIVDLASYIYIQAFRHGEKHGREEAEQNAK